MLGRGMKNLITFALVASIFSFLAVSPPAQAATCSELASQIADETGGEVLNVAAGEAGACDITIRIPGSNGEPPRVVTRTVSG